MNKKLIFKGSFWEYFITNLGMSVITVITFGLFGFYQIYWNVKYFFTKLELEQ